MKPKFALFSKTVLLNGAALALVAFYPPAAAIVQAHPEIVVGVLSALNIGLRAITRQSIALFPDDESEPT